MIPSPKLTAVKIQLPPLHPGQARIDSSLARFMVIVCGRRFGKTTYGVRQCIKGALSTGGLYWWIAPSYKVAHVGWKMLKNVAAQIRSVTEVEIREADRIIIFGANGGQVAIKSADDPDSLRGEKLHGAVFDEFAQIKEETWSEVIRPALADALGWAIFIGTPKGKNWGYRLYELAKNRADWEAFKIPTALTEDGTAYTRVIGTTNPLMVVINGVARVDLAVKELEAARQEMSAEQFAQEFLADFGASQYLVYPEFNIDIHVWNDPIPEFLWYPGGMDFGGDTIGSHHSVTGIAGLTDKDELIILDCFKSAGVNIAERQYNWTMVAQHQIEFIHKAAKLRPPNFRYKADKSQMVGIQFMQKMGLNVTKTKGGPDSVAEGIELVHRRLKIRDRMPGESRGRPRLFVSKDCPFVAESFLKYRYDEPRGDDKVERKNPLKVDDDVDDMVRYLVECVDRGPIGDPQLLYGAEIPRMAG